MYLCIYVFMYLCIYVSMYLCIYVSMYLCIYVSMYLCIYVCIYVSMYLCIYVSMYLCIYVSMYLCMYVCMHACMACRYCFLVYIYIYIYPQVPNVSPTTGVHQKNRDPLWNASAKSLALSVEESFNVQIASENEIAAFSSCNPLEKWYRWHEGIIPEMQTCCHQKKPGDSVLERSFHYLRLNEVPLYWYHTLDSVHSAHLARSFNWCFSVKTTGNH